jgi:hypothetical protein
MNIYDNSGVYEHKFTFPLLDLVRAKAEEKDISYHDALVLVRPDYVKSIRYGDVDYEETEIAKFGKVTEKTYADWEKFVAEGKK